jgi:hypothetical protein
MEPGIVLASVHIHSLRHGWPLLRSWGRYILSSRYPGKLAASGLRDIVSRIAVVEAIPVSERKQTHRGEN